MKLIILADDVGNKLWPVTSNSYPKALLPVYSSRSLLYETLARSSLIAASGNHKDIFIVLPTESLPSLMDSGLFIPYWIPPYNIIGVPSSLGSAVSISIACQYILRNNLASKDEQVAFMTADQFFWPASTYVFHYYNIIAHAKSDPKVLYMLGLEPAGATETHNYISCNWEEAKTVGLTSTSSDGTTKVTTSIVPVTECEVKPTLISSANLINRNALWDLSSYIWNIGDTIDHVDEALTDRHRTAINDLFHTSKNGTVYLDGSAIRQTWNSLDSISFSDDVVPTVINSGKVKVGVVSYVIWATFDNWISIKHLLYDSNLYQAQQLPNVHQVDSQRNLIFKPPDKEVAIFGISDLIIIDTGDKLLIGTPGGIHEHF